MPLLHAHLGGDDPDRHRHLGLPRTEAERLHKARWPIAAAMYLAVAVTVLVAFWDGWAAMLS